MAKFILSKGIKNILSKMTDELASKILSYSDTEVEGLVQNFIDSSDRTGVSFTTQKKIDKFIKDNDSDIYQTLGGGLLSHQPGNLEIFHRLNYDYSSMFVGLRGIVSGKILAEEKSTTTDNIYCLFEYRCGFFEEIRQIVINKNNLRKVECDTSVIWQTSRNDIKIGRFVRAFLTTVKYEFTDSNIEKFVNDYKATHDFMSDGFKQFDIVKGKKIPYWYKGHRYLKGHGVLNNSCMRNSLVRWLEIYHTNAQCNMVILYDDEGTITDGKYTSNKIKGRALLWDCKIDGVEAKFLDRIYTVNDSDVDLFIQFAKDKGYWYKTRQDNCPDQLISDGKITKRGKIDIELTKVDCAYYPYIDTVCYLDTSNKMIKNYDDNGYYRVARSTHG